MTSQKSAKSIDMAAEIKLTRKKYSFNLPLSLASRLEALCELYPYKTRTQVIADLIGLGLAEVERSASDTAIEPTEFHPDTSQHVYLLNGPFSEFHGLTRKHHLAMERELAEDDAELNYPMDNYSLGNTD